MAAQADNSEKITERNEHGGRLRRRGVIAGTAALAAGLLAARTAEPVLAATLTIDIDNNSTANTNIHGPGAIVPWSASNTVHPVLSVNNNGTDDGFAAKAPRYAVYGETTSSIGVFGVATGNNGTGVQGSAHGSYGVAGNSVSSYGVYGTSDFSHGVYGSTSGATNAGIYGRNDGGFGVIGFSANGTGIYGQTNTSFQYAVLGTTYVPNSTAIAGTCTGNGSSAFSGGTANPNAYAGVFQGNVVIQGKLVVSDPSYKNGALLHPDGSHRLVYCVESPESWIEDVGKGALVGGKATVTFDKDFAAVVHTDDYHVFLTSYDATNKGLAAVNRTEAGFTVQEQNGGTSSGGFSWRVMVKPKSTVTSERLAKFTMPNLKLPDLATLPKSPELPSAKKP